MLKRIYLSRLSSHYNSTQASPTSGIHNYKITAINRPVSCKTDLCTRLIIELLAYPEEARNEILKSAVGRIFENIDERYYIQSVKRLLSVELCE
ncbi:MAG: hypothetical protein ACR2IS_10785 [Nitrososphaeraceae archaeon]